VEFSKTNFPGLESDGNEILRRKFMEESLKMIVNSWDFYKYLHKLLTVM